MKDITLSKAVSIAGVRHEAGAKLKVSEATFLTLRKCVAQDPKPKPKNHTAPAPDRAE